MRKKRIALTTVKQMGFTDKLIKTLLPEPKLVRNPHYGCAPPMKTWEEETVLEATKTQMFIDEQAKRQRRKESAKKGLETRKQNLIDEMIKRADNAEVKRVELSEIKDHLNYEWNYINSKLLISGTMDYKPKIYDVDDEEYVDYILECLTSYKTDIKETWGKAGGDQAFDIYFEKIMEKVATVYPELKEECQAQIIQRRYDDGD